LFTNNVHDKINKKLNNTTNGIKIFNNIYFTIVKIVLYVVYIFYDHIFIFSSKYEVVGE